ncbi:MAG: thiamine pyrophosphate-dependent dehydrogenase E1 component subunit alpha [Deltaproteobacteria bacterium]|nr:thiamine pyrophosphate-dependent dehydrogenase E1 component subunit alpha [Deltaproteobacteria bacterium]
MGEKVAETYPQQEMRCPVHLSIGQEAVPTAVCAHLTKEEYCVSTHRAHAHYLAKGGDMKAMVAEFYGRATGCCQGKGGSMHLIDRSVGMLGAVPIVGSTVPIGVGAALGAVLKDDPKVVVVFLGDGAIEEGVVHESFNFAVLKKLPVLFVCENNFFSVYSPLEVRQPKGRKIYEFAKAYGLKSLNGNGNDVEEVYHLTGEVIEGVRRGEGPAFLEFETYRWREHCGPYYDNDLGYRSIEEFEEWKSRCPVYSYEQKLLQAGIVTPDQVNKLKTEITEEIEEAFQFAKNSPYPAKELLLQDVYK